MQILVGIILFIVWMAAYWKYVVETRMKTTYSVFMSLVVAVLSGWTMADIILHLVKLFNV